MNTVTIDLEKYENMMLEIEKLNEENDRLVELKIILITQKIGLGEIISEEVLFPKNTKLSEIQKVIERNLESKKDLEQKNLDLNTKMARYKQSKYYYFYQLSGIKKMMFNFTTGFILGLALIGSYEYIIKLFFGGK